MREREEFERVQSYDSGEKLLSEFDPGLAATMQRVNAPPALERFLMQAVQADAARPAAGGVQSTAQASRGRVLMMPRTWWTGAVAAMLVMGCALGGVRVHHEREQARATAAFELSERITDQTLAQTRQQLQQQGISLEQ